MREKEVARHLFGAEIEYLVDCHILACILALTGMVLLGGHILDFHYLVWFNLYRTFSFL